MKTLLKLDLFQWFFVIAITVSFLLMQNQFVWLKEFPKEFIFPLSAILNSEWSGLLTTLAGSSREFHGFWNGQLKV